MGKRLGTLIAAGLALAPVVALAQAKPNPSPPSAATIAMREQWLNPQINAFTFRDTDKVFEYRPVKRSGPVWALPSATGFTMPQPVVNGAAADFEAFADRTFTNAMLVIRDGKIVFERYRNRSDATTHFISFSMAKTITALLYGLALDQGAIRSLDDKAVDYVPELKGSGYDGVTIRQIMQMRSGVDYEERYDFGEKPSLAAQIHQSAIVRNESRFADAATKVGRKTQPGSTFNYATLDTAVLGWILERATKQPIATFTQAKLWGPTGMEADAFWIADGPPGIGRELNGMGYNAVLRDFGRLGQLMLDDGMRGRQRVLPAGWMKQVTTMLPLPDQTRMKGYGLQTWQVDDESGAYAAVGLAGQLIYVHPATRTVIVKLSYYPPVEPPYVMPETLAFFHAIAKTPFKAN